MMIAIFRANPHAFDGNINRLHHGVLLSIPSANDVMALDTAEAKREYRAQMTSWRLEGRSGAPRRGAANAAAANPVAANPVATGSVGASSRDSVPGHQPAGTSAEALTGRVRSLEHELEDMHRQLNQLTTQAAARTQTATRPAEATAQPPAPSMPIQAPHAAEKPAPVPAASTPELPAARPTTAMADTAATAAAVPTATAQAVPSSMHVEVMHGSNQPPRLEATAPAAQAKSAKFYLGSMAAALALVLAGFAFVRRRLLRSGSRSAEFPPLQDRADRVAIVPRESKPPAPPVPVYTATVAVTRSAETPRRMTAPEPAVPADPEAVEYSPLDETTQSLAIDIEALEQSYLHLGVDSLGIDSVVDDSGLQDTATLHSSMLETVVIDKSELETAIIDKERTAEPDTGFVAALAAEATKAKMPEALAVNSTVLDYNLVDLDATMQHVQMPSQLNDHVIVKERRTNIVDVLKAAIDRDPNRCDLRMKLLETYYSSAAANQRAFMEVVRKASRERDFLSEEDWQKVMMMGREIAAGDIMFTDQPKDDELAHCA